MKVIVTLAAAFLVPCAALAQEPGIEVSAAQRRLHYDYRFENDSSFDTGFLVPHFFEQRYEVTGWELAATATYRVAGRTLATKVSFAPERRAFGSDFDTFFQPDGDIATSGTAGDVMLASLGVEQSIPVLWREGREIRLRAVFRRDRAEFLPADRVVTHTQPPSETREWTTDRETTIATTFETGVEGVWRHGAVTMSAHASPAIFTRLLVLLPDKYPGRDIIFDAIAWGVGGQLSVGTRVGRLAPRVWVAADVMGSYIESQQHKRNALTAGVALGMR